MKCVRVENIVDRIFLFLKYLLEGTSVRLHVASSLALILARLLFFSLAEESSSTTFFVSPRRPIVLNGIDTSLNLIILNVNA